MVCYICDQPMDEVKIDHRDMKTAPCRTCEAVIQECLDSYPKLDKEADDDMVVYFDPSLEEFKDVYETELPRFD